MRTRTSVIASCTVAAAGLLGTSSLAPKAEADGILIDFYTPISECGTVGFAPGWYDFNNDGENEDCLAWYADSGGAFIFNGIDSFNEGDRIWVDGLICNFCETTCAAGAIEDASTSPCDD